MTTFSHTYQAVFSFSDYPLLSSSHLSFLHFLTIVDYLLQQCLQLVVYNFSSFVCHFVLLILSWLSFFAFQHMVNILVSVACTCYKTVICSAVEMLVVNTC